MCTCFHIGQESMLCGHWGTSAHSLRGGAIRRLNTVLIVIMAQRTLDRSEDVHRTVCLRHDDTPVVEMNTEPWRILLTHAQPKIEMDDRILSDQLMDSCNCNRQSFLRKYASKSQGKFN